MVVQMISKKLKDDIFAKNFKEQLIIRGQPIKILKELPKKILASRKEYKILTEKLRNYKVRYRWEVPEGLSYNWEGRRVTVSSPEQTEKALEDLERKFKSRRNSKESQNKGENDG